ncbi:MAG TPA: peptide chain release factor 2, partial [Acidimicrobiales bacterium]|nr:peptide chain release factor 2 [Acidimicrobiales bacterium]
MQDFSEEMRVLRTRLDDAEKYLSIDAKRARLAELEDELGRADLWDDQNNARAVTTEHGRLAEDAR